MDLMRCSDQQPGHPDRICTETDEHTGLHRDGWGVQWDDASTGGGFTREELTVAAAKQQRVAPTKAEILAVIESESVAVELEGGYITSMLTPDAARLAVEKLFKERGL